MIYRVPRSEWRSASCRRVGPFGEFVQACERTGERIFQRLGRHALLLLVVAWVASLGLLGCSTKPSVQVTPTISLSITQISASTLPVGGTLTASAAVTNDLADAGVDWVATCSSAFTPPNCGSFSPSHTSSGSATTFTAPPDLPKSSTVYVNALSSTDHSKNASSPVSLTASISGVTITQPPPPTFPSGGVLVMAAIVAGDPTSFLPGQAGTDWKAICGTVDCTSGFTAGTHSDPGNTIAFNVPVPSVTFPNIIGSTVTIIASSTVDYLVQAKATFNVTASVLVAFTAPLPPSTLLTTQTAPIVAQVSNDPTSAGVDLQISCPNAPCGSWSAADPTKINIHTASGVAVTYYPPTTITGSLQVTITATATAGGASASANITVIVPVSVQIDTTQIPNNQLVVGQAGVVSATVSNDSTNAGVDWTVTCGSPGACGSFSATHSASGGMTTFTAPAAVPSGKTVTITATSTADKAQNASATITIQASLPPNALLQGQFVMLLTGKDANGGAYALGGVIAGDGNGNLTSANLEIAEGLGQAAGSTIPLSQTTPSTYSIGAHGLGQIQLVLDTNAPAFGNINSYGVNGTGLLTLSITFVTSNHALLSETDTFGSGTGTLDLQNANDLASFINGTAGLNGTYSLRLSGAQSLNPSANFFLSGALTFQFTGGMLTETAAIADQSNNGVITKSVPPSTVPVNYGADVPGNSGEISLSNTDLGLPAPFNLNAWIIDKNHFLITDWQDSFSGPTATFIGYLVAQPASPTISGTYAFTEAGATSALNSQAAGGIFTCGSAGILDVTPLNGTPRTKQTIGAACTAPAGGRGIITFSGTGSTDSGIKRFAAYPTLDMGLDLIELDGGSASPASGPSGAGVALQQTLAAPISPSSFSGSYGSNFLASTPKGIENFAAQIVSDGVSKLSGTADVNSFNSTATPPLGTPSSNADLSGSFSNDNNGRFQLTSLTITPAAEQPTPEIATINLACYIVDTNSCLLLGLDKTDPGTGVLQMQQNLGF